MKGKPAIIISLLFGLLAWVFVWLYLTTRERELLEIADQRPVVVAATDILPGTAIEENMIAETQVPLKFLQPGAFSSIRDAVGQVPAVPIQEGGQITGTSMTGVGRSLSTKIPRGRRAVSLAVTERHRRIEPRPAEQLCRRARHVEARYRTRLDRSAHVRNDRVPKRSGARGRAGHGHGDRALGRRRRTVSAVREPESSVQYGHARAFPQPGSGFGPGSRHR